MKKIRSLFLGLALAATPLISPSTASAETQEERAARLEEEKEYKQCMQSCAANCDRQFSGCVGKKPSDATRTRCERNRDACNARCSC